MVSTFSLFLPWPLDNPSATPKKVVLFATPVQYGVSPPVVLVLTPGNSFLPDVIYCKQALGDSAQPPAWASTPSVLPGEDTFLKSAIC